MTKKTKTKTNRSGERWVRGYWRGPSAAPRPHWIAVRVDAPLNSMREELRFLTPSGWDPRIGRVSTFLKRALNKQFKNEIEDGTVMCFKVD